MLTDMNSYPFLYSKHQPTSDAQLGDLVRPVRSSRIIDISGSSFVPARELRSKLQNLLMAGELDGGLPILRHGVLTGLIPAPELEYALDNLADEENTLCLMSLDGSSAVSDSEDEAETGRIDFGQYIDPVCSSIHLRLSNLTSAVPPCPRHPFAYRPRVSMLCQAWSALSVRVA